MSAMAETRSRRPRRRFTDEFKQQAVRLVLDEGKSVTAVARELDLVASALGQWVKHAQADRSKGRTGLTTAEREELVRLRKALRIAEEERDILKNHLGASPRSVDQKLPLRYARAPWGCGRLLSGDVANPLKNMVRGWLAHLRVVTPSGDPV
jgi:transposase